MEATVEGIFQEKTLRGDVQDKILDEVARRMPCWTKMSEHEQQTIINASARIASEVVREAVKIVAHRDFPHMIVGLGKWTVKEGIKLEVTGSDSVEEITKLATNGGKQAILVFASVSAFMGSRAEPQADKDQPDLPMDGQPGHDPETGELLDGHRGEASDDAEALPETGDLPEPPADDEGDGGEAAGEEEAAIDPQPEPEARPAGRRARARQTADA
jgi:hypothetical protein